MTSSYSLGYGRWMTKNWEIKWNLSHVLRSRFFGQLMTSFSRKMTKTKPCAHGLTLCSCSLVLLTLSTPFSPSNSSPLLSSFSLSLLSSFLLSCFHSLFFCLLFRFKTLNIAMARNDTSIMFQWLVINGESKI